MVQVSENLRLKLLEEEFKMRKKQPTAWTKTKFRPFANFKTRKRVEKVEGQVEAITVKAKPKTRVYIEEE